MSLFTAMLAREGIHGRTEGYNMSGRALNWLEAASLLGNDEYRRVAQTWLYADNGYGGAVEIKVSTVFLVMVTEREDRDTMPPLFETALFVDGRVFKGGGLVESIFGYKSRSMTFDEALDEHMRHVILLRGQGCRSALPGDAGPAEAERRGPESGAAATTPLGARP